MSLAAGEKCRTCYGEGSVPTDGGPVQCPDCGGAGHLPHHDTLVEWRIREIERAHGSRDDVVSRDIKWLAFELRRAREALVGILAMTDEADEPSVPPRMRFIANRALGLYDVTPVKDGAAEATPERKP